MKKWLGPLIGILVVLGIGAVLLISPYNNLVTLSESVDKHKSEIDNKLQRRMDLIPNLVETVKGYASHETEVMTNIADARSKMAGASTTAEQLEANDELSGALSRLLVVVENYPELKSDTHFTQLMDELAGTENRISVERGKYNEAVQVYNNKVQRFPSNIAAKIFGFEKRPYFEAQKGAEQAPTVDFGNGAK